MPDINFSVITQLLTQIVVGILGLSFLVLIHEGGHFLVAKKFGVRVRTFAIGFGKTLFSFTRGDTEYCIKAIPFGGYVAMEGEQPGDERSGSADEFASKSIPQRMGIAFGGPAVNLIFAFLTLTVLYMIGVEEPKQSEIPVGIVEAKSPGEKAGVLAGDTITHLKDKPVEGIEDFFQKVAVEKGEVLPLRVKRGSDTLHLKVIPEMHKMGFAWVGIIPGQYFVQASLILPGSPAEKAGFKKGDKILSVENVKVSNNQTFISMVESSKGNPLKVEIERDSAVKWLSVTPEYKKEDNTYRIGLQIGAIYYSPTEIVRRGPWESIQKSFETNVKFSLTVFHVLKGLVSGKVQLKALSGPVGILQVIGNSFRKSFQDFIFFLALISLNLGLMNLLPLVITDGGVILFLLLEAVRGKPLGLKTQMRINQVAMAFFISLAIFITFHDVLKIPYFLD